MLNDLNDEEMKNYFNVYYTESAIQAQEDVLLRLLKFIYQKYPNEKNNENWLSFTDWVLNRRKKR